MFKELTENEIQFMEQFYTPYAMIENLIPANLDAPATWSDSCECLKLWNYQLAMIPYDSMYADDFSKTDKENFQSKIGAGTIFNISARGTGKSWMMDCSSILPPIYYPGKESLIASFDDFHLNPRKERTANIFENHKFFQLYHLDSQKKTVNRGSKFGIYSKNGHIIKAINEKAGTPTAGVAFHGPHPIVLLYDEISYATEQGRLKRIDSVHPYGCMDRFYGIPDIRLGSPLSRILSDEKKKNWICQLPQSVRPDWNNTIKQSKIEEYNGESSVSYRLNVNAEIIEGASGKFDIERIKANCYVQDKDVKYFEISKINFRNYDSLLAIDRLPSDQIFVNSDIGTTASPSEITIIFGLLGKYKYVYNISLFNLTTQEQAKVFKHLYNQMGSCFISLDCTSDGGRAIADELEILGIPKDKIIRVQFNENIVIGFDLDKDGKVQLDDKSNKLVKKERTIDWACQRLEYLFYNSKIEIPTDHKFFKEFSNYFEVITGATKKYGTRATDHLLQSFQCFAIAQFQNEWNTLNNQTRIRRTLGVIK